MTSLAGLGDVLTGLGDAFARAGATGTRLAGFAEHQVSTVYLGSSTGLRLRHVEPTGKLEVVARADGGARSAWAAAGAEDLATVHVEELTERLERRLGWGERKVDLDAGRYEVVLPPDAVADLMVLLRRRDLGPRGRRGPQRLLGAGRCDEGRRVALPAPVLVAQRPVRRGSRVHAVPCHGRLWPGRVGLRQRACPRADRVDLRRAASRACSTTARGPLDRASSPRRSSNNLILELPGVTSSVEDLVGRTERGLLLTCLWYIREVDPATLLLTGLTRDGVYLVEHGEIVGSVNNFRFNESPVDLLSKTIEAGRTERALSRESNEWLNRTAMPALRVAEFNMSSVSPAT